MKPGNAGGGKGPQFKTDAGRSEGPGDWATYQLRTAFRNCRRRCTRKGRQNPATASTAANAKAPARERLTLIRAYEELRALGYEGGYDAVRRYARRWGEQHASATAEAYVPLTFAPGEAYQFDWSHEIVVMDGVTTTVKVAHVRLAMSRMMFVRAYSPASINLKGFDDSLCRRFERRRRSWLRRRFQ